MKIACVFVLFVVITRLSVNAQVYGKHTPGEGERDTIITAYDENNDSTVYSAMQRLMSGVQPISYISPVLLKFWPQQRILPLRFGEGQNGYILEALVDQSFALLQGRSQMDHFAQTSRVSFRYAPALRMTKDNSSNLLPTNQKVGIEIDKVLWDSYTRNLFSDRRHQRFEFADDNTWLRNPHTLRMVHATFNAMHYANGQGKGVYASSADSLSGRNDYIKGDFSTNFINLSVIYSYYNTYLISAALGYQHDGSFGGPFSFTEEQRGRYGMNRLIGFFQYRSQPVENIFKKYLTVKDIYHQRSYQIARLWEHRFRLEFEYIMGSMEQFKRRKDYRFNTHFFYELNPLRSRTAGLMLHLYYGRDYMNIRYDDIILAGMVGVTFTLNKYRHPRFNPNKYVIKEVGEAKFERIRKINFLHRIKGR